MAKTEAEKARRKRQKKRKLYLGRRFPDLRPPTDSDDDEEERWRSPRQVRRGDSRDPLPFVPGYSSYSSSNPGAAAAAADADADGAGPPDPVRALLGSYTKQQLVGCLCDAALADPALHGRIRDAAERAVSHRNLLVRGLSWEVTMEMLLGAFSEFGAVEVCNIVTAPGKCYAFVLFRSRAEAMEALKEPYKQIGNKVAFCTLASLGRSDNPSLGHCNGTAGRKIYVSNVHAEAKPQRLKEFFAKYGEIETGPSGFDVVTGKSKGHAIFLYKTEEGARKSLEEPHKIFQGHQLLCRWAEGAAKAEEPASPVAQAVPASVSAVQNFSLYNSQNPTYAAHSPAGVNPAASATPTLNASTFRPAVDGGLTGNGGSSSSLGVHGNGGTTGLREMQYRQSSLDTPGVSYAQNFGLYGQNPGYAAPAALATPTLNPSAPNPSVDGRLAGYGGSSRLFGAHGTWGTA